MITYETRQDGSVLMATCWRGAVYYEVPTTSGQTEESIQASIQRAFDTYDLINVS